MVRNDTHAPSPLIFPSLLWLSEERLRAALQGSMQTVCLGITDRTVLTMRLLLPAQVSGLVNAGNLF